MLSRTAFNKDKEITLGILRHEMIHAEHDASKRESARQGKSDPGLTTESSEVLGYVEGFMTMFHLRHPPPSPKADDSVVTANDSAFVELLGAVTLNRRTGTVPWERAANSVKSKALGQLQEYYCHVLYPNPKYREAFEKGVEHHLKNAYDTPDPSRRAIQHRYNLKSLRE